MSVAFRLNDEFDIGREDMIVRENNKPQIGQEMELMICWLNEKALEEGKKKAARIHCCRIVSR